jgi:hypothetical protein
MIAGLPAGASLLRQRVEGVKAEAVEVNRQHAAQGQLACNMHRSYKALLNTEQ